MGSDPQGLTPQEIEVAGLGVRPCGSDPGSWDDLPILVSRPRLLVDWRLEEGTIFPARSHAEHVQERIGPQPGWCSPRADISGRARPRPNLWTGGEAGLHGVSVDVATDTHQVSVSFHHYRREAPAEYWAISAVAVVDPLGEPRGQEAHAVRELCPFAE